MSDSTKPNAWDWDTIAAGVSEVVGVLAPLVTATVPALGPSIVIGEKIIQGVIAAEPVAVALYERIMSGEQPTADELRGFADDYEAAYQQLKKDIADKLSAIG